MVRGVAWSLLFLGALAALVWYGATGETGPMGWLNHWQQVAMGSYSRRLSFLLLCFGGVLLAAPLVGLWMVMTGKSGAAATVTPPKAPAPALRMSGKRILLILWLGGVALGWAGPLVNAAWDFHQRRSDAAGDYLPTPLDHATGAAARPDRGSHLALQGQVLWDRGVTRQPRSGSTEREALFMPVAGADWMPGEAVRFIVQMDRRQAAVLQRRAGDAPLRVRVTGAVPTATEDFFMRAKAPLAESVVLVEPVAAEIDAETDPAHPPPVQFDGGDAILMGTVLSVVWTVVLLALVLAGQVDAWKRRRRAASLIE